MYVYSQKNEELNKKLVRLWNISNKLARKEFVSSEEKSYFNNNLSLIREYYDNAAKYWKQVERQVEDNIPQPAIMNFF